MAALRGQLSVILKSNVRLQQRAISKSQAFSAAWNKDWMPSKELPKTPEEIEKVAAKYNVPPEKYKPSTEPYGDYPDLGVVSQQQRDPNYHWDDFIHRRDYGEFVDLRFNYHTEDRNDPLYRRNLPYPVPFMWACICLVVFGFGGYWMWCEQYPHNRNFFDSQHPYNNKELSYVSTQRHDVVGNFDRVVHYSFEPANK